jgi:pimeloyl-ACP methyl ester carboxylesterase
MAEFQTIDWWRSQFPQGRQTIQIAPYGEPVAIAYGEKGKGQPMFLLHGIGSWSYSWRYLIDPFAQHFRVIGVDASGHGYSQPSTVFDRVGHQVIELQHVVHALTDQPAIFIGESMGALTALALAQHHPELVSQLVLINVPIFPKRLPSEGMRLMSHLPLELVQTVDQLRLVRPFAPLVQWITRIGRREVVIDPDAITDEEIYWLTHPYIEFPGTITQFAVDLKQGALEIERSLLRQPGLLSTLQQNLSQVTCSTLILWGQQDRWFPIEDGKELAAHLPNAQFQVIANCGHNAISSNPAGVRDAVLAFLLSLKEIS